MKIIILLDSLWVKSLSSYLNLFPYRDGYKTTEKIHSTITFISSQNLIGLFEEVRGGKFELIFDLFKPQGKSGLNAIRNRRVSAEAIQSYLAFIRNSCYANASSGEKQFKPLWVNMSEFNFVFNFLLLVFLMRIFLSFLVV